MSTLKGIIRNGQVIVTEPTDLPDGTEVEILPVGRSSVDEEGPMTPDEIARTLAAMDKIEPLEMSDAERATIEADRQARKEWEKRTSMSTPIGSGGSGNETLPPGHRDRRRLHQPPPGRVRACPARGDRGNRVWIGIPVLAELVYGIEQSTSRDRNMQRLRTTLPAWKVWPFDDKAAFEYGRLAAELKRIGRPMQQVDIMIAAITFSLGNCSVVTADTDLAAVPGLTVENWAI